MIVTAELLKKFPILNNLSDTDLDDLAAHCTIQKYNRREVVSTAGKFESSLCFLFEGRLQGVDFTIDGREVGLYFVEPGGFCGELALFDSQPQPEHVIALTSAVTVSMPVKAMSKVMKENSSISNFLSQKLAIRIREMTLQRSLLSLPNIGQRVCCQLSSLLPVAVKTKTNVSSILNPPTHMEIAIMLNVSRETVSRVFQNLQNQSIVRRIGSERLEITNVSVLKELAEGGREI